MIVGREVAPAVELVARHAEAPPLDRDVAHGSYPGIAGSGCGREINLDALCVHSCPHQRQIVFPADHCADLSQWRVEHRHRGAIAKTPHQPLGSGWHYLAMLAQVETVGCEEQCGTIEGASVPLDDANDEVDAVASGRSAECVNCRTGNIHAALPIPTKVFTALLGTRTDHRPEVESSWISRKESFGKEDQLRAFLRRLSRQTVHFL